MLALNLFITWKSMEAHGFIKDLVDFLLNIFSCFHIMKFNKKFLKTYSYGVKIESTHIVLSFW